MDEQAGARAHAGSRDRPKVHQNLVRRSGEERLDDAYHEEATEGVSLHYTTGKDPHITNF